VELAEALFEAAPEGPARPLPLFPGRGGMAQRCRSGRARQRHELFGIVGGAIQAYPNQRRFDCTTAIPLLRCTRSRTSGAGSMAACGCSCKGYDSDAIRRQVEDRGAMPNIPPKANRRWKNCFSPFLYRNRNAIERMFCRLKDFRRVAPRYDRNAKNFLTAVCIAATVSYWL
jgi:transposase